MLTALAIGRAWGFGLVLFRTAGLVMVAPVFSARAVPARIRLGIAAALAVAAWFGASMPAAPVPDHLGILAGAVALEILIGLSAGLVSRLVLDAAVAAGHAAGLSMGLGYGAVIDPSSGAEAPAIADLLAAAALAAAVAAGLPRDAVLWLVHSVREIPPGTLPDLAGIGRRIVEGALLGAVLAVRLGLPLLGAATLGHFLLGVAGRTAPQLSLQTVGFAVAILAGGGALWLATPAIAELAARGAAAAFAG